MKSFDLFVAVNTSRKFHRNPLSRPYACDHEAKQIPTAWDRSRGGQGKNTMPPLQAAAAA